MECKNLKNKYHMYIRTLWNFFLEKFSKDWKETKERTISYCCFDYFFISYYEENSTL